MYSSQGSQSRYQELTLVKLSKNSIDFPYIPDKYLHFILTITNESNFHIAYKFKSTQPQKYLVKTDQNIIEPHKEARINFTMHPDLIKDKLQVFKDNFQLVVAKLSSNNESLENIFKRNKNVIETQITKLQVRIISPTGDVLNNQNKLTQSSNNFQSPQKNGGFDSASQSNQRQNLIPVDLKGQQDPNLKYQNINNSTAFLSQKLQEKEDQLHNIQRETERYSQNIQSMTTNNAKTPDLHQGSQYKGGKSKTFKAVAAGILLGVVFTVFQNLFSSSIDGINPLNL